MYLEDSQESVGNGVKIGGGTARREIEISSEKLHSWKKSSRYYIWFAGCMIYLNDYTEKCEYEDEEEK